METLLEHDGMSHLTLIQAHTTTLQDGHKDKQLGFWALTQEIYPTIPYEPIIHYPRPQLRSGTHHSYTLHQHI